MYPQVRQFETRALEAEAEARLAWERRAAARRARLTATKRVGWSRTLSTGRPVPPAGMRLPASPAVHEPKSG
jgi:hypothetical protein